MEAEELLGAKRGRSAGPSRLGLTQPKGTHVPWFRSTAIGNRQSVCSTEIQPSVCTPARHNSSDRAMRSSDSRGKTLLQLLQGQILPRLHRFRGFFISRQKKGLTEPKQGISKMGLALKPHKKTLKSCPPRFTAAGFVARASEAGASRSRPIRLGSQFCGRYKVQGTVCNDRSTSLPALFFALESSDPRTSKGRGK